MSLVTFRPGENISTGDVVFVGVSGLAFKANAIYSDQASAVGIATTPGTFGSGFRVDTDGVYANYSGLTPSDNQYVALTPSGGIATYSGFVDQLSLSFIPGAYLTVIGRALSASGVSIERGRPIFINNTASRLFLESGTVIVGDAMLLEDGSFIDLETNTP
jgi:hypothetical protein